jgi:ABC-2 type transport system ATP-binding protein
MALRNPGDKVESSGLCIKGRAMSLLEVSNLSKSYDGRTAVEGVSFHVAAGEVFGLLGPNGAGKSTTMTIIAGLLRPDSGKVTIEGALFEDAAPHLRRMIGLVPQDLAIYPDLTAEENLSFFASLYDLATKEVRERVRNVLQIVGLEPHAGQRVNTFSGGMKRRLNFGVALLHQPKLLVLDEPTVGVDPQSRSHLLDCIRRLSAEGMAVVYASHYMEEVQAICDRVGILDHGRLIACDSLANLLGTLTGEVELTVFDWKPELSALVAQRADVDVRSNGETRLVLRPDRSGGQVDLTEPICEVLAVLREHRVRVRSLQTRESNLERLFLELTGRQLRD